MQTTFYTEYDGVNIQILEPRKEFTLVLSVRSIISGDVRAVDSCALKRTSDNSVVSEALIHARSRISS